ncbi:MAG TPA: kelch repeat-containing protein, partial [Patescibacteria group bacterium]|nr:kelch repeat-containing protein [Patescibacteria group bacterium]
MNFTCMPRLRAFRPALILLLAAAPMFSSKAGTWTNLASAPPGNAGVQLMLLLSDGTVMAQEAGTTNNWFRLTPDNHGSYINGAWSTLAPMNFTRQYYTSAVLRDGRVFVAGGEYGSGGSTAEIYDPKLNTWTVIPVPAGLLCTNCGSPGFSDSGSVILPDGNLLIAPVSLAGSGGTVIYNVSSNSFFPRPSSFANQNEATWVKLPDDSILTIDPSLNPAFLNTSERFIPSLNNGQGGWIADKSLPVPMYNGVSETG